MTSDEMGVEVEKLFSKRFSGFNIEKEGNDYNIFYVFFPKRNFDFVVTCREDGKYAISFVIRCPEVIKQSNWYDSLNDAFTDISEKILEEFNDVYYLCDALKEN